MTSAAEVPSAPVAAPAPPGVAESVARYGRDGATALDLTPEPVLPPVAPEPVVVEAFVNGAAAALEKATLEIPTARLRELLQRGPEGYRELTLYLPEKLAQQLSLHCIEHNLDMNRLVATAVELLLSGTPAVRPAPEPLRRADDEPSSDGLLSLAARALLAELTDWVKAVWATRRRSLSRTGAAISAT